MRILADTDVPVPRTLWLEEDPAPLGSPFYVMERVAGEIPEDNPPYHTAGWLTRLDPARRATLWWSGLEALCHVHRLDWRDLGLDFLASCEPGDTPLARHLAYYARYLEWLGLRGRHPTLDAALAWLEAEQPDEAPSAAVCWGDARIGNMIFRDARCVAVLDWEMARLGDPVEDLAWWIVLDRHHSEGCDVPRLPGLPKREATVARWQERTGREPRHLAYHEVFAAFRFAAIIARVGQQLRAYGFLPPDATFEIDNTASRLLARMGDFPPPSA